MNIEDELASAYIKDRNYDALGSRLEKIIY